jgi:hypothetical protein
MDCGYTLSGRGQGRRLGLRGAIQVLLAVEELPEGMDLVCIIPFAEFEESNNFNVKRIYHCLNVEKVSIDFIYSWKKADIDPSLLLAVVNIVHSVLSRRLVLSMHGKSYFVRLCLRVVAFRRVVFEAPSGRQSPRLSISRAN